MASIPPRQLMLLLWALPGGSHFYTLSLCDPGVLRTISSLLLVVLVHQDLPLVSVISQVPLMIHSSTSFAGIKIFCCFSSTVTMWLLYPFLIDFKIFSTLKPHKTECFSTDGRKWNTQTTVSPIVWGTQTKCLNISTKKSACLILLTALTVSSNPAVTAFVAPTNIICLALFFLHLTTDSNYYFLGEDFYILNPRVIHSQNNI